MNLTEWHAVLESTPATPAQIGRMRCEFQRLGWPEADRAGRLAVCAELLDLDSLDTSRDLTMGQAGWLVKTLSGFRDLAELDAAAGFPGDGGHAEPDSAEPRGPSVAEALMTMFAQVVALCAGWKPPAPSPAPRAPETEKRRRAPN